MDETPAQQEIETSGSRLASIKEAIRERLPKWPLHFWLFILTFTLAIIFAGLYLFLSPSLRQKLGLGPNLPSPSPEAKNIWEPAKPPPAPLASGPQTYKVSGSTTGAPKITEAIVDPIDPASGSDQKWVIKTIEVGNGPIKEVTVTIFTDNEKKVLSLSRTGTNGTEETWEGSWQVNDTYDYKYVAILRAKNEIGKIHKVDLVLR